MFNRKSVKPELYAVARDKHKFVCVVPTRTAYVSQWFSSVIVRDVSYDEACRIANLVDDNFGIVMEVKDVEPLHSGGTILVGDVWHHIATDARPGEYIYYRYGENEFVKRLCFFQRMPGFRSAMHVVVVTDIHDKKWKRLRKPPAIECFTAMFNSQAHWRQIASDCRQSANALLERARTAEADLQALKDKSRMASKARAARKAEQLYSNYGEKS